MNSNTLMTLAACALFLLPAPPPARAQTDASLTFEVTTVTAGGAYAPRNVMAIWVTDAQTNFVKTLKRQAQTQMRWLIKWGTQSRSNVVDGITGATLSSHQAHSVTWNGRDVNGVIVPDGTYRVFCEFTEYNGQGPYLQTISFTKGATAYTTTPANVANFTSMRLVYTPLSGPPILAPIGNRSASLSNSLSFAVTATATGGDPVTLSVSNRPAGAFFNTTNAAGTFTWPSPAPIGVYTMTFHAVDKDGGASETIRVFVNPTGTAAAGLALGSPLVSGDPANPADQNNPGDAFDFDPSGGYVTGVNQGGFGDFGRILLNADATNLYLGGTGLSVGGNSNAAIVFIGVNTHTADVSTLWNLSGLPQGLDALHNIAFATPMDLAIVLGDEYGDGTFNNFNLAGGYNFGQGIFRLSGTSFTAVAGARLSQFDGMDPDSVTGPDDDGNRLTERWECAIPWSSLGATGATALTHLRIAGILVGSATNGPDRFLSGNYLGRSASPPTNGNYQFSFVILDSMDLSLAAGHDVALLGISPDIVNPATTAVIRVLVTNRQNNAETVVVTASNRTAGAAIGSVIISNLPPGGSTNAVLLWNTEGLIPGTVTVEVAASPAGPEVLLSDNSRTVPVTVRLPLRDMAISSFEVPPWIRSGSTTSLVVQVANLGDYAETVSLVLTDLTDRVQIALANFPAIAPYSHFVTNLPWSTAGRSTNYHDVVARITVLPNEAFTGDNERVARTALAPGVETNLLIARGSLWRYRDDGIDLTSTPWRERDYYDGIWKSGPAPLGFGNGGEATSLATTTQTTHFFRHRFAADRQPLALLLSTRHDDGIAIHLNGQEAVRHNLGTGPLSFTSSASVAVRGTAETSWFPHTLGPVDVMPGWNVAAVQVHQTTGSESAGEPWINEIHYDNTGTDTNEGLEIAGPAGLDLAPYSIVPYNGPGGQADPAAPLSGLIPNQSNGLGALWFAYAGLRNGPTDGVALVKSTTQVLQFLSYEGVFTGVNGAASGLISTDIGVAEEGTSAVGHSLQLGGTGTSYGAFTWRTSAPHSRGLLNPAQSIPPADAPDLLLDLELRAILPLIPARTDLNVLDARPAGPATSGERLPVDVIVSNSGTTVSSFHVLLVNTNDGSVLAATNLPPLAPGEWMPFVLPVSTLGWSPGTYNVEVFTVFQGVTNRSGGLQVAVTVAGTGWGVRPVDAIASIGGHAGALAAAGPYGYLGAGATLQVIDFSNPDHPVLRGSLRLPGLIRNLITTQGVVYAACGAEGLHVIDALAPDAPRLVDSYDSAGSAERLAMTGNLLLLADGPGGIRIFDRSQPLHPILAGLFSTRGPAQDVAAEGGMVYALDGFEGVVALQLSTPSAPQMMGRSPLLANGRVLTTGAGQAVVLDEAGGLIVLDLSAPHAPAILGRLLLPAPGRALVRSGSIAHVAAGSVGILNIDLSAPAAPALLHTLATTGESMALARTGNRLGVADGFSGIRILDVSNPAAPVETQHLTIAHRARDAASAGNLTLLAAGAAGVRVFQTEHNTPPALLATIPTPDAHGVLFDGRYAYIAHGRGRLSRADLLLPTNPVLLEAYSNPQLGAILAMAHDGSHLAISDGTRIELLNTSASGTFTRIAETATDGYVHDLTWNRGALLVADGPAGLVIRDGATLQRLGAYNTEGRALAVRAAGVSAFVADGDSGWLTFDLRNPSAPVRIHQQTGPVHALALSGSAVDLMGGPMGVTRVDVSAPLTPVARREFPALLRALRLRSGSGGLLVPEEEAGLAILPPTDPDEDGDGLPDWWEQQLVDADRNDLVTNISQITGHGDFDGDGALDREEFAAGTDARDAESSFIIQSSAPGEHLVIRWNSAVGRTYTLLQSTNLLSGFTPVEKGIVATYPVNTYTTVLHAAGTYIMIELDP